MKIIHAILFSLICGISSAQTLYFPPLAGNNWSTVAPASLNWCQPRIDSLYNFLSSRNTKGFIILKDGKIVLEKYFGTFTADSIHYWASAGKSLTAMLTGIAQQKGLIKLDSPVSDYLGQGWTTALPSKESLITVRHLLNMSSGLDDSPPAPCDNEDSSKACLLFRQDAGTRWAYHTGAYKQLQAVIAKRSGLSYNAFTNTNLASRIGMSGLWFNGVYFSKTRGMARFGLLALNKGIWNGDTVLKDQNYFNEMVNTSQNFNLSYGFLWWLNGKTSYKGPGTQIVFPGPLIGNAPSDMFCALGKNDQKIYVVPGKNMVIARTGNSAYGVTFAFSDFDSELWDYINKLDCSINSIEGLDSKNNFSFSPNPNNGILDIRLGKEPSEIVIADLSGQVLLDMKGMSGENKIDISQLENGIYFLRIHQGNRQVLNEKISVVK